MKKIRHDDDNFAANLQEYIHATSDTFEDIIDFDRRGELKQWIDKHCLNSGEWD